MIDKVIVCGLRRAKELVPMGEIQQTIGRAGRSYNKSGEAVILCPASDFKYAESCFYEQSPPIISELTDIEKIAFHVLPWLDMIYDEESFQKWYQRSLSFIQNKEIHWQEVFNYLFEMNCIDEEYNVTPFGNLSIKSYYSPAKLSIIKNKLLEVNANGEELDALSMSYILSSDYLPMSNVDAYELSEYKSAMASQGYVFENGELIHGFAYYCILINNSPKWIKHITFSLKEDLARLFDTIAALAKLEGLNDFSDDIKLFSISALRKVTKEIAKIINEFNVSKKSSAYELFELGIETKQDLTQLEDKLIEQGSQSLKNDLQEQGYLKDLLIKEWRSNNA